MGISAVTSQNIHLALSDELVLYLPFDEGSGNIGQDFSGKENHGTLNGSIWITGKFGSPISLFSPLLGLCIVPWILRRNH